MFQQLLLVPLFILSIHATGQFGILEYPPSLDFKGDEKLQASNLGDVLAASLGFYVDSESKWSGLYINDPFTVPKSAFVVLVDGVNEIHLGPKAKNYKLIGDSTSDSLNMVAATAEAANSLVIDVDLNQGPEVLLGYSEILGDIDVPKTVVKGISGDLKPHVHSEDKQFLQIIATLNGITEHLSHFMQRPNLFMIRVSLRPLATVHGEISPIFTESLKMLSEAINNLANTAKQIYNEDILFVVASSKIDPNYRSKRDVEDKQILLETPTKKNMNLATDYNEDYPVIFNIILWFGVIFAFALLAVSYTIAAMDPGRDSIIYRMTSTRMKKDN